jgi:hypothetical protein
LAAAEQAMQVPAQEVLQQTPLTQLLVTQSLPVVHACPCPSWQTPSVHTELAPQLVPLVTFSWPGFPAVHVPTVQMLPAGRLVLSAVEPQVPLLQTAFWQEAEAEAGQSEALAQPTQ